MANSLKTIIKRIKGFTLIELIIVVAIIAVLGTAAFLILTKWLGKSRDASRIANLRNIQTTLDLFTVKSEVLPDPDNSKSTYISGGLVFTQGEFGEQVVSKLQNISKAPKDGEKYYSYSLASDKLTYQLGIKMEDEIYKVSMMNNVYADLGNYFKFEGNFENTFIANDSEENKYFMYMPSLFATGYGTDGTNDLNNNTGAGFYEEGKKEEIIGNGDISDINDQTKITSILTGNGLVDEDDPNFAEKIKLIINKTPGAGKTTMNMVFSENGKCGSASMEYERSQDSYGNKTFCEIGSLEGTSPLFPGQGETVSWICKGVDGGENITCNATRKTKITVQVNCNDGVSLESNKEYYNNDVLYEFEGNEGTSNQISYNEQPTEKTCEWKCKTGFAKRSGLDTCGIDEDGDGIIAMSDGGDDYSDQVAGAQGNDDKSVLLIQSNKANGNVVFENSGNGSVRKSFGQALYFDGDGDYLELADSVDWNFGESDFTIDFWVNFSNFQGNSVFIKQYDSVGYFYYSLNYPTTNPPGLYLRLNRPDDGSIYINTWESKQNVPNWKTNEWYHVAMVKNDLGAKFYKNGVEILSLSSFSWFDYNGKLTIGENFNGYMDDIRITKEALNINDIYKPGQKAELLTNTKLLLDMNGTVGSNVLQDKANLSRVITPIGNVKIQDEIKVVGTVQHSTNTKQFGASSIKFDGAGNYVMINDSQDFHFGGGDFTIDFWVNNPTSASWEHFIDYNQVGSSNALNGTWRIDNTSDNKLRFSYFTAGPAQNVLLSNTTIPTNQWVHLAVVRSGNLLKIYQNGTQVGSKDVGNLELFVPTGYKLWLGGLSGDATYSFSGYLDEIRISKGVARWSKDFIPPTRGY